MTVHESHVPEGATALITGAAGALGSAIAEALASTTTSLLLVDRDATGLARAASGIGAGGSVDPLVVDLADPSAVESLCRELPRVDVLVNVAGIYPTADLDALEMEQAQRVMQVNYFAPLRLMQACAAGMRSQGAGRIVNITSIVATGGWTGFTAYAASKGALAAASRIAAKELGPHGVTVNCVAPGAIPTPAEPAGTADADVLDKQALRFRGTPGDVATAVAYLVSDDARFVTGQTLNVDGGWVMT